MKCCQQKYIYSHFYHDSMFILGIKDKSVRILCFRADKFDLKLFCKIVFDFREPEDNDSQALYPNVFFKTSRHSKKKLCIRKEVRHFGLKAK